MLAVLLAALLMPSAGTAAGRYRIAKRNEADFRALISRLVSAYEQPSAEDAAAIDGTIAAIRRRSETDGALAEAVASHWRAVYLDKDYALRFYRGDGLATELLESGMRDGPGHAFVVLGYELKNGRMAEELRGRCDAAAAAARAFPASILVCSGGATGANNPDKHTEAGEMKAYLTEVCGIDASRIFIDEEAMTTAENAVNTFAILRAQDVHRITVVTSGYHQRWGQVLMNAMAALCRLEDGYGVSIEENFCFSAEPPRDEYRQDDRMAAQQLRAVLHIPRAQ